MTENKPKFKIGDTLYPQGCSKEYQEANPFIPKYIEEETWNGVFDDELIEVKHFVYSENGFSWYPESTLVQEI